MKQRIGNNPKKSYKDRNGTTRAGDFLRSIGKTETLNKILGVAGEILTGDIRGAISIISGSTELSDAEKELVIKELEKDIVEEQEITKRWEADMKSDSWLAKNIRPLVVANFTLLIDAVIISSIAGTDLGEAFLPILMTMGITAIGGYFTLREYGKTRN